MIKNSAFCRPVMGMFVIAVCCTLLAGCSGQTDGQGAADSVNRSVAQSVPQPGSTAYPDRKMLPATAISPVATSLTFSLELSPGHKWVEDAPTRVVVSSATPSVITTGDVERSGNETNFNVPLDIHTEGDTTLLIDITAFFCAIDGDALCFRKEVKLAVPVTVRSDGDRSPDVTYTLPPGQPAR